MKKPVKKFKLTLSTEDGEVLDSFEVALAGSKAAMLESCDETVGGFGSSALIIRLQDQIRKVYGPA